VVTQWDALVAEARKAGETLGGIVRIEARNVPAGLGEPVFDKLEAVLAHAIMSVGAVKGVEIGEGFAAAALRGSQNNDALLPADEPGPGKARFASNHAGGILGGISSGQDIVLRAAVKPIASIAITQNTVDKEGNAATVLVGGRHDLAAIPRVVPVLEAMTALALADALLLQQRMGVGA
jgi:chorismate synthase